ncbi:hypothetical protein [Haloferax sp. KTX1]|uniref:hypothetical protein n=1 Tax=Haloferax sp. KTX1 TaxID=2600597 RepID=UPI0011DCE507|nr:hypothetical protein [Haloferax sp. KTX1]
MNAQRIVADTVRNGYRNLVGTVVVSVLVSLSVLPLVAMLFVGSPLAVLTGLWATTLLSGVGLVVGFRFASTVAERGVSVPIWSEVRAGVEAPRTGLLLGGLTFLVVLVSIGLMTIVPAGLAPYATGVAASALACWYLVVGFASPELAALAPLRTALRASLARLLSAPSAVVLFTIVSLACTLVAGVTVVTVGFFLPGILCLLAAHVTVAVDEDRDAASV